jgi:hypothetical protein
MQAGESYRSHEVATIKTATEKLLPDQRRSTSHHQFASRSQTAGGVTARSHRESVRSGGISSQRQRRHRSSHRRFSWVASLILFMSLKLLAVSAL